MSRRYLIVFAACLVAALVLARLKPEARHRSPTTTAAAPESVAVSISVADGQISPELISVPLGQRVVLRLENDTFGPKRLVLSGYEDAVQIPELPPHGAWKGAFLADRPGEDFAWLLDGEPAGKLRVLGSHLVEGHR